MSKAYFWSLLITPHVASVCLWSRDEEKTSVLIFGPEVSWETEEELVKAVDMSLTEVSARMPDDSGEPTKTVFGVMSSWVSEGRIKKEYLARIRETCEKLTLSPVGFVVIPEAISHEVRQNEGGPLSAVLVGVGRTFLEVTLFRLGTMSGTIEVHRSVSLTEDLIEALSRFQSHDSLPSRFIVFGAGTQELSSISHLLSSVNWKEAHDKLSFLHEPKVELAESERVLGAISLAGSSEMGPVHSFTTPKQEPLKVEADINVVSTDVSLDDLGFAMNADITQIIPRAEEDSPVLEEALEESEDPSLVHEPKRQFFPALKSRLVSILARNNRVGTLPVENRRDILAVNRIRRKITFKHLLILVSLSLFLLVTGVIAALYYIPRSEITLFISPRTLSSREMFTLSDTNTSVDIENKVLPVLLFKKTVSLQESAEASGSKVVGEKASGSVTIRNGTANSVNLPAGALLVGPNDLQFALDQSASVSAATSPASPGTVTVSAKATVIGTDSNISQDQTMKVGKFLKSEIDAVVSTAFTGGSSRQITAVSKADLDSLEKSTLEKLVAQANQEISSDVPDDASYIADSVSTKTISKVFDHKVNDEASAISLSMEIEATAYAMPKNAISEAAKTLLSSQVPGGYSFRPEQVETSFEVKKSTNTLLANVGFTAHLLPNVNPDEVAKAVSGKKYAVANDYLATIPGFVRVAIVSKPALPEAIRFIPFKKSNILVSIEAEK